MAGCQTAVTPTSILERDAGTTHALRQEPHRAAVCIARNIDRHRSGLDARIRQGTDPVLAEVHVSGDELVALAHLLVSGSGSTAVIRITPNSGYRREDLIAAMLAEC